MTTNMWGKVVRLVRPATTTYGHSEFLETVKQNINPSDRMLVIISGADESSFDIGVTAHNLTSREQVALLEVAKLQIYTKLMSIKNNNE